MYSVGGAPGGNYAAADRAHCRMPRRSRSQARDQFGVLHADHDDGWFDRDCDGLLADGRPSKALYSDMQKWFATAMQDTFA